MASAGALAGLVGANFVLGYKHYYEDGSRPGVGFMGIAVAVLGAQRPLGVVPAALLFGTLAQGALAVNALVPKEIVDVVEAVIILGAGARCGGRPVIGFRRLSCRACASACPTCSPRSAARCRERSGVMHLGLEGMLLAGAFAATVGAGLAGAVAGVARRRGRRRSLVAALYAWAVLRARADQIVGGVALNLLAVGVTRFLLKLVYHSSSNSPRIAGVEATLGDRRLRRLAAAARARARTSGSGARPAACACAPSASTPRRPLRSACRVVARSPGARSSPRGVLAGLGGAWLAARQPRLRRPACRTAAATSPSPP